MLSAHTCHYSWNAGHSMPATMHPVSKGPVSHVISLARIFALQHIPVRFFRWCGWVAMHIGPYYHCACTAAKGHYCCLQEREYQSNNRLTDRPTDPLAPLLSRSTRDGAIKLIRAYFHLADTVLMRVKRSWMGSRHLPTVWTQSCSSRFMGKNLASLLSCVKGLIYAGVCGLMG